MTIMGWIFMIVSWSLLSFFMGWCMYKILQPTTRQSIDSDEVPHTG
jgi:hypothetical protein